MRNRSRYLLAALAAVGLLALSGCGRDFDATVNGAHPVPGFEGVWQGCIGNVLVFYADRSDKGDEIEGMFYGVPECGGDEPIPSGT